MGASDHHKKLGLGRCHSGLRRSKLPAYILEIINTDKKQILFTGFCVVVIMIETVGGAPHAETLDMPQLSQLVSVGLMQDICR